MSVEAADECRIDLHHLMATRDGAVSEVALWDARSVPTATHATAIKATQALVAGLFALPVERSPEGPIATLPAATTALPRAKSPPQPKEETKWEAFAKAKGIKKRKKGRMAWDEKEAKWAPTWGYKRRGDDDEPIIEVKGDDIMVDPRAERAEAKKARIAKGERLRLANEERTRRHREAKTPPSGVPIDLGHERHRGKSNVDDALALAQKSTASLGKFDARRDGEKPPKAPRGKKRKFQPLFQGNDLDRSLAFVHELSQPRAKPPKKGQAEVMDTHDGELPNADATKRKKGRAAAGKIKKVTKKRSK